MSVNGNSGMLSDAYSDIESQAIKHNHKIIPTIDGFAQYRLNGNADYSVLGDLDRDELAELVYVEAVSTLNVRANAEEDQDQLGSAAVDFEVTINEPDNRGPAEDTFLEEPADQHTLAAVTRNDAANQLFNANQESRTAFDDTTNGTGGVGAASTEVFERRFRTDMGGGPVLDRFDDIFIRSTISADNVLSEVSHELHVQLYFVVDEFESNIARFGRP
jgi:hypothetical protein